MVVYIVVFIILSKIFSIQLLITYWRKWEYKASVQQLFTHFRSAYASVTTEIFYSNLTEIGMSIKRVRLIKMCLKKPIIMSVYVKIWLMRWSAGR
jgi:hypothetical protein